MVVGAVDLRDVLGTSLAALRANPRVTALATALVAATSIVLAVAHDLIAVSALSGLRSGASSAENLGRVLNRLWLFLPLTLAAMVAMMVAYTLSQAVVTFATLEHIAGRQAPPGAALSASARCAFALLLSSVLTSVLTAIGALFCLVPGLVAMIVFALATPAIVAEQVGGYASLSRSIDLTRDGKLPIFLALVVYFSVSLVTRLVVGLVLEAAFDDIEAVGAGKTTKDVLDAITQGVLLAWYSAILAVIYARIRGMQEEIDVSAVSEVFA